MVVSIPPLERAPSSGGLTPSPKRRRSSTNLLQLLPSRRSLTTCLLPNLARGRSSLGLTAEAFEEAFGGAEPLELPCTPSGTSPGGSLPRALADALGASGQSLRHLDLSRTAQKDSASRERFSQAVATCLAKCPSLRTLKLSGNGLKDSGLELLLTALNPPSGSAPLLEELDLSWNRLTNGNLIARLLVDCGERLRSVNLEANEFDDVAVVALCAGLSFNLKVQVLNLARNTFADEGLVALANSLRHQQVSSENEASPDASPSATPRPSLARWLVTMQCAMEQGSAPPVLGTELGLRQLDISNTRVADVGAVAIAGAISSGSGTSLALLAIHGTSIGAKGRAALEEAIRERQFEVERFADLAGTAIRGQGILELGTLPTPLVVQGLGLEALNAELASQAGNWMEILDTAMMHPTPKGASSDEASLRLAEVGKHPSLVDTEKTVSTTGPPLRCGSVDNTDSEPPFDEPESEASMATLPLGTPLTAEALAEMEQGEVEDVEEDEVDELVDIEAEAEAPGDGEAPSPEPLARRNRYERKEEVAKLRERRIVQQQRGRLEEGSFFSAACSSPEPEQEAEVDCGSSAANSRRPSKADDSTTATVRQLCREQMEQMEFVRRVSSGSIGPMPEDEDFLRRVSGGSIHPVQEEETTEQVPTTPRRVSRAEGEKDGIFHNGSRGFPGRDEDSMFNNVSRGFPERDEDLAHRDRARSVGRSAPPEEARQKQASTTFALPKLTLPGIAALASAACEPEGWPAAATPPRQRIPVRWPTDPNLDGDADEGLDDLDVPLPVPSFRHRRVLSATVAMSPPPRHRRVLSASLGTSPSPIGQLAAQVAGVAQALAAANGEPNSPREEVSSPSKASGAKGCPPGPPPLSKSGGCSEPQPATSEEAASAGQGPPATVSSGKGGGKAKGKAPPPPPAGGKAAAAAAAAGKTGKDEVAQAKGKGKGPPPPPTPAAEAATGAAKGKGKGKGAAPPPKASVKAAGAKAKAEQPRLVRAATVSLPGSAPFHRKIYWKQLELQDMEGTIFDSGSMCGSLHIDTGALQRMFEGESAKLAAAAARSSSLLKSVQGKAEGTKVLSDNRARNVAIILKRLPVSTMMLSRILSNLEWENEVLRTDQLEQVHDAIPTKEEAEQLKPHCSPEALVKLRDVEQMVIPLTEIRRGAARVKLICCARNASAQVEAARGPLASLREACAAIHSSQMLREVLLSAIEIGNYINYGDSNKGAKAITIGSLLQLRDFKIGRMSSLHFLCAQLRLAGAREDASEALQRELRPVVEAARYQIQGISQVVRGFDSEVQMVATECKNFVQEYEGGEALDCDTVPRETIDIRGPARQRLQRLHEVVDRLCKHLRADVETTATEVQETLRFCGVRASSKSQDVPVDFEPFLGQLAEFVRAFRQHWGEVNADLPRYSVFFTGEGQPQPASQELDM